MKALYTIIKPVVTEKATAMGAKNKYAFWVNRKATKIDIKNSIKEIYGAEVKSVRMMNTPSKSRNMGRRIIDKRHPMRKALISLKGDKKLDITKMEKDSKK